MKETRRRSIAKSIVWRIICIIVSIITSFLLTGRWDIAIAIGSVYNVINMILYYGFIKHIILIKTKFPA